MALPELCCLAFNGRPDTRWSWVVCACAAVSQAMTMGVLFSFGVLFPVFIEHFKETREKTGGFSRNVFERPCACYANTCQHLELFANNSLSSFVLV